MKTSDYVSQFLAERGVRRVYEMCGGMITHLLDSLSAREDIDIISMHHEQAAGFAAEAEARITGVPGVAMATSGPGATNLLTAIGSCHFDSVPVIFITGQVNTYEQRGESGVRQSGFQETDIVAIASPITKAAWRVKDAADLPGLMADAFTLALSGRKGPVLLDIPMDVQRAEIDFVGSTEWATPVAPATPTGSAAKVLAALARAERPLILAGGGVRASHQAERVAEIAHALGVPVVTSLLGLDVIPADDALRVGLIGTYGNRWANEVLGLADVLVVLGSRLDSRQTGADVAKFIEGKTVVQVDVDPAEMGRRVPVDMRVDGDLAAFLADMHSVQPPRDWSKWTAEVARLRAQSPDEDELSDISGVNVASFMHLLSAAATGASSFVVDVGQNQMWAAQSLRLSSGQRFLTSAGMGAMGFALPGAVGAALAAPGAPVVVVAGDGGMQVNIQELETVARLRIPLKIVVLNNNCLGMVRQFQDEYFGARNQSTVEGYGAPSFAAVADAYGIDAKKIEDTTDVHEGLSWLFASPSAPSLLEVVLPQTTCVRPKVAFGNPVFVMDPPPGASGS